ncbi:MAG: hypothetical protein HN580_14380 [Deltaproteobacteria bacterium]|jgi:hypothetical protein|nr:hypothetical protein [Deltaproteobacteria bacterium]MBT4269265.1 hypothetical protein [Deltaproteobacteria bacterium]MBT4639220.1 hypothetical protein [Deltaproteobacteria bacterium]MBT6500122.1 hypothetical protein [Deltaproteobacteria bacterium]MBT6611705.1 hypothetical protein [Deltaproteobacteria bacterium]
MKKDTLKYVIYLFLIPWSFLLISACKTDNALQSSLTSYAPLLSLSKYISYNLTSSSQVKGVHTVSLTGTQSFDSNYWGWEQPTSILSNSDKTISTIYELSSTVPPGPQNINSYSNNLPFSDGTFPTARAYTGIIRPLSFASIKRTLYNASGELTFDNMLSTYFLTYDATSDLIQSYSILNQNNTTDSVTLNTYGFSGDPRSYSTYYPSSYTKKTGSNNTLVGSVTTAIAVGSGATFPTETHTYQRFDENGDLGSFDASGDLGYLASDFFDDANSQTIVKIVTTVTYYPTASGDISADSIVTETIKYASSTNNVYREVTIDHYANFNLRQLADYQYRTYNITGSTETQINQSKKFYSNGFLILDQFFLQSSGWTSPSSYFEYGRDAQGRKTSLEQKDASGDTTYKEAVTFDSSGRTATIRSYNVDSSSVETCSSNNNKDYTYELDSSTNDRMISDISYGCTGDSINSSPSSKITRTYNSQGKLIKYQLYSYPSNAYLLISQTAYGYGSSGEKIYDQSYSIDGSGVATETNRTEYTYDDSLYKTSTLTKNSTGEIVTSYYVYTYSYR